jgi:hypothetical protein
MHFGAGHGSRAVYGIHWLRSLGNRDRGIESYSGHGCLVLVCVCVRFFCICVQVDRPCDELITRPRNPIDCQISRKLKSNGDFHGGRPRPKLVL